MTALATWGLSDCEAIGHGLLRQPVNAVSAAGFLIAGAILLARAHPKKVWPAGALGAASVAAAAGSIAFHGPMPGWARTAHDASLWALVAAAVFGVATVARRVGALSAPRRLAAPAALLVAGGVAFALGRTDSPLCAPDSLFQFHALWHLLAAGAVLALGMLLVAPSGRAAGSWHSDETGRP